MQLRGGPAVDLSFNAPLRVLLTTPHGPIRLSFADRVRRPTIITSRYDEAGGEPLGLVWSG